MSTEGTSGTAAATTGGTAGASGASGTAAGGTTNTSTQTTGGDWTTSLNDEMKGYVQTKGFKDPAAVLESYRNYEKLQGVPQERILKLPENLDTPEGLAIFERLGKPKEAKGYTIEIPKEHGDTALADAFRELAFKNNFTQKQTEGLVKWWNDRNAGAIKNGQLDAQNRAKAADDALKRDWGNAYEQNKSVAERGMIAMGFGENELAALGQALGPDKAMKLLHKLGSATGEAEFISGQSGGGGQMAADAAKSELSRLQTDPGFITRLRSGDTETRKQWDRLHASAYPGMTSL